MKNSEFVANDLKGFLVTSTEVDYQESPRLVVSDGGGRYALCDFGSLMGDEVLHRNGPRPDKIQIDFHARLWKVLKDNRDYLCGGIPETADRKMPI